ncbi:SDR family NAD(P)-dependent oxidoreductase [Actinosynnema mirum]|uniref:Erythronolide synthase n=1 Tax=Actinosynnema mirum (strain ATCC 29888 / DSM 43827 / JCM 3225 / NBRC 14064 / NCIMB 13271 / NRRL B-12336 / IMRU 3971 / 101) TaxID=446462 RepID=C6WG03_ACTMD|nr:type I polyketide synthase [Actinosynnema mirum]ACU37939.1 Erythronolide synthase [Actinosynnema mirum DSM 43827]
MSDERISVVGIGLRYPDAATTAELWENVLAGRRAFRRLPDERMNLADYHSPDPQAPDRFYATKAAVLRDFEFDRVRYRVAGSTYRSTDLTHWLALDTTARALADAGFPDGEGLPRRTTGVVLGNSLTGEFSRANVLRLRWPYVRRTVAAALAAKGWPDDETADFLDGLEGRYKAPFPPIDEDSLAGGLANTIAGRVCNHFDLRGGGYTVDGACSSSLLSVTTAAKSLVEGDLDVAIAGGVDLSIDPFEVIGFAKTGALATGEMKVYDRDSNGFWPGEGSGALVLLRERDALERGLRVYATITGWGVSSDGKGGITRPEADGHRLALDRAYSRAGYNLGTVSYFEGHGTGTALGDATEIEALSSARRAADPTAPPAALGTVKGNIGHTKAAAGVAGLIKAVLALHHQVIPPATGHHDPHPKLDGAAVRVPLTAEAWPGDRPLRAGVSAMGFGGINTHIALEAAPGTTRRAGVDERAAALVASRQDAEVLLLDAADRDGLAERVAEAAALVPKLAMAELGDLAAALAARLTGGPHRAALVITRTEDAARKLDRVRAALAEGTPLFDTADGVFLGEGTAAPALAFLFPGQGSGKGGDSALRRRFASAEEVFRSAGLPEGGDQVATEVAQPRIVAGSLAALGVLRELGVEADRAAGHSLGELTAAHWAGALDAGRVLSLATERGRVMAHAGRGGGAMASLAAGPDRAAGLAAGEDVVVAGFNGPDQTVLSGPADAVDRVCAAARARGVHATRLPVSHAFHSPLVAPAADAMAERLVDYDFGRLIRPVHSTVTGAPLAPDADLRALLREQITGPVRFQEAATGLAEHADLVVEVGPGRVLTGLLADIAPGTPALSVDADSASLAPLLTVVAAAHALGAPIRTAPLFADRVARELPLDGAMTFLASPCETAPPLDPALRTTTSAAQAAPGTTAQAEGESTLDLLRRLAAQRAELPLEALTEHTHPLDDLHLSSITVGQLVNEVTRGLGRPALETSPNFATARLGELADLIDELAATAHDGDRQDGEAPGVAPWVRPFRVVHVERPLRPVQVAEPGDWTVHAPDGHRLTTHLEGALPGDGVLLLLPPEGGPEHVALALTAARDALATGRRFALAQGALGMSGLARTLHLEAPHLPVTVVDLAAGLPDHAAAAAVVAEIAAGEGFTQARYAATGARTVPVLRVAEPPAPDAAVPAASPLGPDDVLLVTGGGKGITAECALAVATDTGAALALLGRADPADDAELAANLARMTAAGVRHRYERADTTDPDQLAAAVTRFRADLGDVTAVLHGAGRNEPTALPNLTEDAFRATLAPKVDGLRAVLDVVGEPNVRLLITFGSIIGRAGLRGEAHYATANDWLTELTTDFARRNPEARALALEWSVWAGAGMGERLGVVEALMRDGITPISTDAGVAVLRRVLADPTAGPALVVSGRAAGLPTLELERAELPLTRFTDRVVVHYPGVELVTEADLSGGSDPYLEDHQLDGDLLFPAVVGMEAMTQVAAALTGRAGPPLLEDVRFLRPIAIRPGGALTVRLAALATGPDTVEVVVRAEDTGFSADHFRATVRLPRPDLPAEPAATATATDPAATATTVPTDPALPPVPVDPVTELYGGILFQGKRFQRLQAYRTASARRAVAEVATTSAATWFAPFLPQERLLADPGARDVMMHAIQCCVPDAVLLPQGVERLHLADPAARTGEYVVLDARERSQDGDSYTYDLDVRDPSGVLVERWEGLVLRAVRHRDGKGPWTPTMLGPHLERALERVLGGSRAVVVEPDPAEGGERRAQTALALSRALGAPVEVRYRPDGKPEVAGHAVSASHGAGLTLAATAPGGRLGVDVETAAPRTEDDWAALLGRAPLAVRDLLARETGEDPSVAGTRVWGALECLRKTGSTTQALALERVHPDGWVVLSTGDARVATWTTTVDDRPEPVVFAVLAGQED